MSQKTPRTTQKGEGPPVAELTVTCKRCGAAVPLPKDLDAHAVQIGPARKAVGSVRCTCGEYVPFVVRR